MKSLFTIASAGLLATSLSMSADAAPKEGSGNPARSAVSIIPCSNAPELSKNIIQKRLAFDREWSGLSLTCGRKAP